MKISEYRKFMKNMVENVESNIHNYNFQFADNCMTAMIDDAVLNGINVDGIEGKKDAYSRYKLPRSIRAKHILNGAGRFAVEYIEMQSWGDFRIAQGLTNKLVNLKYTGEFWKSFDVITLKGKVVVMYFGETNKMIELENKYGEFHKISDKILAKYKHILEDGFRKQIMKNL